MIKIKKYRKGKNMKTYIKSEKDIGDIFIARNWEWMLQAIEQSERDIENGDVYDIEETLEKMDRIIEEDENDSKNL